MINFFDVIGVCLLVLRWYGLIEINGWWIVLWFVLGFTDTLLTEFVKELKKRN